MRTVRTRTGKQITPPLRYWVQARSGAAFSVHGKFASGLEAKQSAARLFGDGDYAAVIVQNIDNGKTVAEWSRNP